MDKLNIAIEIILNSFKCGLPVSTCRAFQIADEIENEAVKRVLYYPKTCPKCYSAFQIIDLDGQFRCQCDCTKTSGKNAKEALLLWWDKVSD